MTRPTALIAVFLIVSACATTSPAGAATIRVPADQPTIQAGIDAAVDGDTVLVSAGVYEENIVFRGRAITVSGAGGAEQTIIDGTFSGPVATFNSAERQNCVLTGFTLRNGGGAINHGGGIHCIEASPTISGNIISGNRLHGDGDPHLNGAGIYLARSEAVIRNNLITDNAIDSEYGQGGGGGIGVESPGPDFPESSPLIVGNTISGNSAGTGGGILIDQGRGQVIDNLIEGNQANWSGGGILFSGIDITVAINTITGNSALRGGGAEGDRALTIGNEISHNQAGEAGGIFYQGNTFHGNHIHHNTAAGNGGGIRLRTMEDATIETCPRDNVVEENTAGGTGGGLYAPIDEAWCRNWLLRKNQAESGAGIVTGPGNFRFVFLNVTLNGNSASEVGGGILMEGSADLELFNGIVWGNQAPEGSELSLTGSGPYYVTFSDVAGGWEGAGNIDADPLFASGPGGSNYLGQVAAGQPSDSPCVDSGSPSSPLITGTTRTDEAQDTPVIDMGFHYPRPGIGWAPRALAISSWLTDGFDAGRSVFVWNSGYGDLEWTAGVDVPWLELSSTSGTVGPGEVAEILVTLDTAGLQPGSHEGVITLAAPGTVSDDVEIPVALSATEMLIVAGPGHGFPNPPLVRLFLPESSAMPWRQFRAYGANQWGVNVSCGDLNGDGWDVILTGPGPGSVYGPHVRGFDALGTPIPGLSFLAYGTHRFGVNVAAADLDGDGDDEIITGAGPGAVFGPHVRAFTHLGPSGVEPVAGVSFFAYGTLRWGVNVAGADIDGDGFDEIITGAGPGSIFGPHVRGWNVDGGDAGPLPGVSFFAYEDFGYGVRVSGGDVDGDGIDEIVTAPGPWERYSAPISGWNYDGSEISHVPGFYYRLWGPDGGGGARVYAGADLDGDGRDEVLASYGSCEDSSSAVLVLGYENGLVSRLYGFTGFPTLGHGALAASGRFRRVD